MSSGLKTFRCRDEDLDRAGTAPSACFLLWGLFECTASFSFWFSLAIKGLLSSRACPHALNPSSWTLSPDSTKLPPDARIFSVETNTNVKRPHQSRRSNVQGLASTNSCRSVSQSVCLSVRLSVFPSIFVFINCCAVPRYIMSYHA